MAEITFNNSTIEISAAIIAEGLALAPKEVPALMRAGEITGLYEEGADADAGRTRVTFFHRAKRFRIIVADGRVIQKTTIDFGERALPAVLRRPGG